MGRFKIIKGFTLIETVVVVAVVGLVLPAIFTVIFVLIGQQTKINRLSEVKKQGDYVLNSISVLIKNNAVSIHSGIPTAGNEKCLNDGSSYGPVSSLYFLDKKNDRFRIWRNGDKISSASAITTSDLTTTKVTISNFLIGCEKNTLFSPATVSLSFFVSYNTTSTRPEETASLFYQTLIFLRNH